ncbi:MAG: DNA polymerase III subunit epsilon [Zetaproteobacteria bacterium]|nr:MAG: DNA polymerase III subunit epsilon [Zetaproteobacteria bacterium]
MRCVILDTETTGLSPQKGDRMVEIGAVELVGRRRTGRRFHRYINPQRSIPQQAVRIHGIDDAKVADAPLFREIADELLAFIEGATLVIHNAEFDLGFLMYELAEAGKPNIDDAPVIDTLALARRRFPDKKNTLDALCDRFGIARDHRTLHGALLDSELLAEVYLALTGGRQLSLVIDRVEVRKAAALVGRRSRRACLEPRIREQQETAPLTGASLPPLSEEERQAHRRMLERILEESGGALIWREPEMAAA